MSYKLLQLNGTVSSSGTAQQIISTNPTLCRVIVIQALPGNVGTLYVGNSSVVQASVFGIALIAGNSISLGGEGLDAKMELNQYWVDSSHSGDGYCVLYF